MSDNQKPRGTDSGKAEAPLAQLKDLWRRSPETVRDYWREQLSSSRKLSEIRAEILTKLKIKLSSDGKLSTFRDWMIEQDLRDAETERQLEDHQQLEKQNPNWTLDQVREEVLTRSYMRSLAQGDFKLGLATSREHTRKQIVALEREKFEFDASKAALKIWPSIRQISSDKAMSESDKVLAVRQKLFGVIPK
jgi:hypothetical protein